MELKKTLTCTVAALAVASGAAGTAQAADDDKAKLNIPSKIVSCDNIEVIEIPILSAANSTIDCSKNVKEENEKKSVYMVKKESVKTGVILPRGHNHRR